MKTKRTTRTTEITVERDEVHVIRTVGKRNVAWCMQCACETQMMTPEDAMAFAGVSERTVSEWVASGMVHSMEAPIGPLLICVNSLLSPGTLKKPRKHQERT